LRQRKNVEEDGGLMKRLLTTLAILKNAFNTKPEMVIKFPELINFRDN